LNAGLAQPANALPLIVSAVPKQTATRRSSTAANAVMTAAAVSVPASMIHRVYRKAAASDAAWVSTAPNIVAALAALVSVPLRMTIGNSVVAGTSSSAVTAASRSATAYCGATQSASCRSPAAKKTGPAPGTNVTTTVVFGIV
jgi:hypothetical protein